MEYEGDEVKTLESRLAQIEEWKRCKDDAEYRAKVKAENEYWEAVEKLKEYHKRIENICTLANRLLYYGISCPCETRNGWCGLYDFCVPNFGYRYYFGLAVRDSYGVNTSHYILYDFEHGTFCKSYSRHSKLETTNQRPETEELTQIYNAFTEFEKKFYDWFDKATKID